MTELFGKDDAQRPKKNHLFYGDNLTIMREMPSASVDLIYLDPPFNSQRTYNLLYKQMTGLPVPELEEAFCDAWEMDPEKEEMARQMPVVLQGYGADEGLIQFWDAWIRALRNTQPQLLAYLVYMTYRLFEMRRILKHSGTLYLHCDPTASHYLKVILDGVFGHDNFRNEIIWKRTGAHGSARRFGPVHDVILAYGKSTEAVWTGLRGPPDEEYIKEKFTERDPGSNRAYQAISLTGAGTREGDSGKPWRGIDPTLIGRHWAIPRSALAGLEHEGSVQSKLDALDTAGLIKWPKKQGGQPRLKWYADSLPGAALPDVWTDISPLNSQAEERLGYPTQKPIKLLDRIIRASTNEGDVVFDPFCGCGTTIYASHLSGRTWIGCDIAILSVRMVQDVLSKRYGLEDGKHYSVTGVPVSVESARDLFQRDPRQFQNWAVELAGGFCSMRHSGDRGIDGRIYFETKKGMKSMVLSVKGGEHLQPAFVRELRGTVEREGDAELGGLICLGAPTRGMLRDVADAGVYDYLGKHYPMLQIRTIEDLLAGRAFETPSKIETMHQEKQRMLALSGVAASRKRS